MVPTRPGRTLTYALVCLQGLPHWAIRYTSSLHPNPALALVWLK